jgi:hypothetical protein
MNVKNELLEYYIINDLVLQDHPLWKFVDDTTASEVVSKGIESNAQSIVDQIGGWSTANHLQLNAKKCKELRKIFRRVQESFLY